MSSHTTSEHIPSIYQSYIIALLLGLRYLRVLYTLKSFWWYIWPMLMRSLLSKACLACRPSHPQQHRTRYYIRSPRIPSYIFPPIDQYRVMDLGIMLIRVALQKYQKDAIYRQMLEYKREKATLESQLKDVQKRSVDHDDHLRVIDAWWSQVNYSDSVTAVIRADG